MRMIERVGQLHPHSGEVVDVEEAAVVDVVGCNPEMREPPILVPNQGVQALPALEVALPAVQSPHGAVNRLAHISMLAHQGGE